MPRGASLYLSPLPFFWRSQRPGQVRVDFGPPPPQSWSKAILFSQNPFWRPLLRSVGCKTTFLVVLSFEVELPLALPPPVPVRLMVTYGLWTAFVGLPFPFFQGPG